LEISERLIWNIIEGEIEKVACDKLGSLGTTIVSDMLDLAGDTLQQYDGDLGETAIDPLYLERNTNLPDDLVALDL
jgi:hypothetical protein